MSSLSSEAYKSLRSQLNFKLESILTRFADYVNCIRKYLETHEKVDDVCYYLTCLPCSKHRGAKVKMLFESKRDELLSAATFIEVFIILQNFTSYLNYHLFEKIIEAYIPNYYRISKEQLEYPSFLNVYLNELKISEFKLLKPIFKGMPNDNKKVTILLEVKSTCRLSKITELRAQIAHIMRLDIATVQIYDIGEGSVVVTLLIPSSIKILEFTPQQENMLQALSVMKLECDGCTYFTKKSGNFHEAIYCTCMYCTTHIE